jgi:hypothetical protein
MRLCKVFLTLGVAALLCAPAFAQQPGGRGRGGFGGGANLATLAQNKSVQEELKINEDGAKKVKEALDKVNEDLKDDVAKLRGGRGGGGNNVTPEERAAARKKVNEAQEKALKGVLTDQQMTRLGQIRHQQEGLALFTNEDNAKALKLTDDQKTKIKEISDNLTKERRDLLGGGGGGGGRGAISPENQQKLQAMNKDAMSNAQKTLTDDQKKTLEEMLGKPFDYKPDAGGRGGRGQPGKPRTDF